jgi:hypothetical protein
VGLKPPPSLSVIDMVVDIRMMKNCGLVSDGEEVIVMFLLYLSQESVLNETWGHF